MNKAEDLLKNKKRRGTQLIVSKALAAPNHK